MGGGAKPNCNGDPRELEMPGLWASAKESYRWQAESAQDGGRTSAGKMYGRLFKRLKGVIPTCGQPFRGLHPSSVTLPHLRPYSPSCLWVKM